MTYEFIISDSLSLPKEEALARAQKFALDHPYLDPISEAKLVSIEFLPNETLYHFSVEVIELEIS